jgi:hypothetical protein
MPFLANDHTHRRRASEPNSLDIPPGRLEHVVTSSCKRGKVRHLTTGHKPKRGTLGQPEQFS